MSFLIIDSSILKNHNFKAIDKLVLAYILNLNKGNKSFYGSVQFLSNALGVTVDQIAESINWLTLQKVIVHRKEGIKIAIPFHQLAMFICEEEKSLKSLSEQLANKFKEKITNG
jgi:hypothetical protein